MKILARVLLLLLLASPAWAADVLLQSSNLTYLGGFRLPQGTFGTSSFLNGGLSMTYRAGSNSLFIVGHGEFGGEQHVAEISIPALVNNSNIATFNTATVLQGFADLADGHIRDSLTSGCQVAPNLIGGMIVSGSTLYFHAFCGYDTAVPSQQNAIGKSGLTLSNGSDFQGWYGYNAAPQANTSGYQDGWFTAIPASWQSALGGDTLVGQCCISIASRSSFGPSAYSIRIADIGVVNPVVPIPLRYYTIDHPLGDTMGTSNIYNRSTVIRGAVFPVGSKTVLYFGGQGTGSVCYGVGQNDPALHNVVVNGTEYCYDLIDHNKGYHAYPYRAQVWAYNVDDLVSVKNGSMQPWASQPYTVWETPFPVGSMNRLGIAGAAYDSVNQKIYVAQYGADDIGGGNAQSVIHAFQVNLAGSPPAAPPPAAPSGLLVK